MLSKSDGKSASLIHPQSSDICGVRAGIGGVSGGGGDGDGELGGDTGVVSGCHFCLPAVTRSTCSGTEPMLTMSFLQAVTSFSSSCTKPMLTISFDCLLIVSEAQQPIL